MLIDMYDNFSPVDFRDPPEILVPYLSENAFTRYKLAVECAAVRVLARRGFCSEEVAEEVKTACDSITTDEVYEREGQGEHDIGALVESIRSRISNAAKPFVHLSATSWDIVNTANAARFRDTMREVFIPALIRLERTLVSITWREAETKQISRTHGQHALPITFGFAIRPFIGRLGESIENLIRLTKCLRGKYSGAVGAHNASSLFLPDSRKFEAEILAEFGLEPDEYSTQITPPEPFMRLFFEIQIVAGILANIADDMRNLQRTEIGEVAEMSGSARIGSSTMPHKINPAKFENVKSNWKILLGRIITVLLDQISEHQRDLTNSASSRTYVEIIVYAFLMTERLNQVMENLVVNHENLERNLNLQKGLCAAEALYVILAILGHPDAYKKSRELASKARKENRPFKEVVFGDPEMKTYLENMAPNQIRILENPSLYTGIAVQDTKEKAILWNQKLKEWG